jgi:hypothetical protein
VIIARHRYDLVLWVVAFLGITWATTLFFSGPEARDAPSRPGLVHEVTSYLTRIFYQETLFFLIPFYATSTVPGAPDVVFLVVLVGLALLACIDLVFDRLLRTRPVFALSFFAVVAFAALNLLLPLIAGLRPQFATPVAALLAVGSAIPLVLRTARHLPRTRLVAAPMSLLLVLPMALPQLIPPVPLRVQRTIFSSGIDRSTLTPTDTLAAAALATVVGRSLFVIVQVFAPIALPADVHLEWWHDGELLRVSREVGITAHATGFRVWDRLHPDSGDVAPGRYRVVLLTNDRRILGIARLTIEARTRP